MHKINAVIISCLLLFSCNSNTSDFTNVKSGQAAMDSSIQNEIAYNDFNSFIEKFSTDTLFQISHTIFPLKITWHEIERDTIFYKGKSEVEFVDFRIKEYNGEVDRWKQNIVIEESKKYAVIEIRGVDNGIHVDYIFKIINDAWMFVEIDDSST